MYRSFLLRSLSVAALSAGFATSFAAAADAQVLIQGGGATSPQGDYAGPNNAQGAPISEFSYYNAQQSAVQFSTYWGSGSGTGQTAFLNNDLTCDINKVSGANGGKCSGQSGGVNTVHYAPSDFVLSSGQVSSWATSVWGQSAAGNLIQIPTLGTGTAIVVNNPSVTKNGGIQLSDNDLCEIFSGGYTNFSQITDSKPKPAPGPITLVYRSDSAATTFIITTHLAAVCTAQNTNPGVTFTPTSTFANLFPTGINNVIPGALAESLSSGVANTLSGLTGTTYPNAIGYLSPDWTSIPANPDSFLSNGQRSELLVASIYNGKTAYLPTTSNIISALAHVTKGTTLTPPTTAQAGANPLNWVPVIQVVSAGYPLVGYGTIILAQCYANKTIQTNLVAFLKAHYGTSSYKSIQANNGLVPITNSGAAKFYTAVLTHILGNAKPVWNDDIGDKTACPAVPGR